MISRAVPGGTDLALPCLMFTVHASHPDEATMFHTDPGTTMERQVRALVLDGDATALEGLRRALEDRRVTAVTATDGTTGLERLFEELLSLDVLVMDLDLPHRDARTLARLIRQAGNERDLALIVLADRPTPALRAELRDLGVDAVVARQDGPAAAVTAALEALRARAPAEELELQTWRHAPAPAPLGETWWTGGRQELAMVA